MSPPPQAEAPAPPAAARANFRLRGQDPPMPPGSSQGRGGPPGGPPPRGPHPYPPRGLSPRPCTPSWGGTGDAPGRAGFARELFFNPKRKTPRAGREGGAGVTPSTCRGAQVWGGPHRRHAGVTPDPSAPPLRRVLPAMPRAASHGGPAHTPGGGDLAGSHPGTRRCPMLALGQAGPAPLPPKPPIPSSEPPLFGDGIQPRGSGHPTHTDPLCAAREAEGSRSGLCPGPPTHTQTPPLQLPRPLPGSPGAIPGGRGRGAAVARGR